MMDKDKQAKLKADGWAIGNAEDFLKPVTVQRHELKTVNPYFQAVWDGIKTFELRKNDRNYQVGDLLWLNEYFPHEDGIAGRYGFRKILVEVIYILNQENFPEALSEDWIILQIFVMGKYNHDSMV